MDPQFIKTRLEILSIEDLQLLLEKCIEGGNYKSWHR